MEIMKNIMRKGRKYEFVKEYESFIVYRDIETNIKECFLKHDLQQKQIIKRKYTKRKQVEGYEHNIRS